MHTLLSHFSLEEMSSQSGVHACMSLIKDKKNQIFTSRGDMGIKISPVIWQKVSAFRHVDMVRMDEQLKFKLTEHKNGKES